MTERERWHNVFHYLPIDHVPDREFGYWDDTLTRWRAEGLPDWVTDNGEADRFFGFERAGGVPGNMGLIPGFEGKVLEEDESHRIVVDGNGVKSEIFKDGHSSIPHYLEFPVRNRASWEDFKRRLDPATPGRFPDEETWQRVKADLKQADYPVGVSLGSLYGWPRNWMGFEGAAIMMHDDPELMHEIMEHITQLIISLVERPARELKLDFGSIWEDMAFRNGPMISPRMFDEFMVPRYQRITNLLREHGCDVFFVDCDGNINELVALWLKGGVNCMFPVEVAAGSDPIEIREKHGKECLLMGGVNKRALAQGREAIRAEVQRLLPLVQVGGFIPHVDHRVPPDVSYQDYLYYLDYKRDLYRIPRPEPKQ